MRKFEVVEKYKDKEINLPKRSTKGSAGYDFESAEDMVIPNMGRSTGPTLVPTGIKACMDGDEYLMLANRSSNPKRGLYMATGTSVIDADYYNNEDNEGHIFVPFINLGETDYIIKRGDRIAQGIFHKFYLAIDDRYGENNRTGGFGSSGR